MTDIASIEVGARQARLQMVSLPRSVWLVLIALAVGLLSGMDAGAVVKIFNAGFGRTLGEFALVLIPSFVLAACLSRLDIAGAGGVMALVAPMTAAGMVCPDTSYAALSSAAERHKPSVAFGSYAGYRLLFPAGPLIVATGLQIYSQGLFVVGILLLIPVWLAGELWARAFREGGATVGRGGISWRVVRALAPLILLAVLLAVGSLHSFTAVPLADFLTRPKGALLVAAAWALMDTAPAARSECLDAAVRRTASLLLLIGAASAFGGILVKVLPLDRVLPADPGVTGTLVVLFLVTMLFKIVQGSSMATFAAVTPVVAPLVHATALSPVAAIFAVCLGSFAIMPTDSFYWLVRSDVLADRSETQAIGTLAGGAALQAVTGFAVLCLLQASGII
jgi:GntP family gluconate:H+ symporter